MKNTVRWLAGCAVVMLLAACHAPAESNANAGSNSMELKVYDVPASQTRSLARGLSSAFFENKINVSVPSPGKLLIYAPRATQNSIGDAIAKLSKSSPDEDALPEQIQVHFWTVDAHAGEGTDDPALKDLAGALAGLRQSLGPMHFQLDESVSGVTAGTDNAQLSTGSGKTFQFKVTSPGRTPALQISYMDQNQKGIAQLSATFLAPPGQYIVLAQAPVASPTVIFTNGVPTTAAPAAPDKQVMRLLIMRVDRMKPTN
jgi:hypothetical protein